MRPSDEQGFSLVEVMVAATVLVLGIGATLAVLGVANRASAGEQRNAQALSLAQKEIETIRRKAWANLALANPLPARTAGTPDDDIRGTTAPTYLIRRTYYGTSTTVAAATPVGGEPLMGGGTVQHVTTGVSAGNGTTATVYRYVTARQESCLATSPCSATAAASESKRITVAVVLNGAGTRPGRQTAVYSSTVVDNPRPGTGPRQPGLSLDTTVTLTS